MKKIFDISGMTCAACAAHVEKAVKSIGVQNAEVNLLLNRLTADTDVADGEIISAVERAGYGAVAKNSQSARTEKTASA